VQSADHRGQEGVVVQLAEIAVAETRYDRIEAAGMGEVFLEDGRFTVGPVQGIPDQGPRLHLGRCGQKRRLAETRSRCDRDQALVAPGLPEGVQPGPCQVAGRQGGGRQLGCVDTCHQYIWRKSRIRALIAVSVVLRFRP